MTDYKSLYFQLAAKVADAIDLLISAQQQVEIQLIEQRSDFQLNKKQMDLENHGEGRQ